MGDLETHPPATDYRGVVDCEQNLAEPPVACDYRASKTGQLPVPILSTAPCASAGGMYEL